MMKLSVPVKSVILTINNIEALKFDKFFLFDECYNYEVISSFFKEGSININVSNFKSKNPFELISNIIDIEWSPLFKGLIGLLEMDLRNFFISDISEAGSIIFTSDINNELFVNISVCKGVLNKSYTFNQNQFENFIIKLFQCRTNISDEKLEEMKKGYEEFYNLKEKKINNGSNR